MTFPIMGGGFNATAPAFPVQRSVRLRSSAPAYFSKSTYPISSPGTKFTMSFWMKVGTVVPTGNILAYVQTTGNGYQAGIGFANIANGQLSFWQYNGTNGYLMRKAPAMLFRDPSAWYHVVCIYDTTNATAEDRAQIWVNGVRVTDWAFNTQPALNSVSYFAANSVSPFAPWLGAENRNNTGIANPFDGYLTEINFVDGQALAPSNFGSYNIGTGVWQPIKYAGTYGTNGFYLNFQDNSGQTTSSNVGIGKDSSGNGNYWVSNGITLTPTTSASYDSMLDVPTNTSPTNANFAVGNPLNADGSTWSGGNLNFSLPNSTNNAQGTVSVTSGKYYWEVVYSAGAQSTGVQEIGLRTRFTSGVVYAPDGTKLINGTSSAYGATFTTGDIIGVALDMDASTVTFYKNNTSQGAISLSGSGCVNATFTTSAGGGSTSTGSVNFGQRPFTYTPPTGFKSLNTYNLPAPTIPNGAAYMAATTYTGTGSALTIANTTSNPLVSPYSNNPNAVPMQPDFVWVKGRSGATDHALYDSVRGTTKDLVSNSTAAETTQATGLTAFDTGGFTVGALAKMNTNTSTYVGWQWKASGTTTNIAVGSVSSGIPSIASTVSANPSAGFSIVTYTGNGSAGATVGHGLGVTPKMIIVKPRSTVSGWSVFHANLSPNNGLALQSTSAQFTAASTTSGILSTSPTSTTFGFVSGSSNADNVNNNTVSHVAYCFSEIAGYSKFGSYTGNGSTDGVFVYTGFRPRFVMIKVASGTTDNWEIIDTTRNPYNGATNPLYPNLSNAESSTSTVPVREDILSNGFKIRSSNSGVNFNGGTYIYAAFAESPFNYSLAR
jgi:hypothetical protein